MRESTDYSTEQVEQLINEMENLINQNEKLSQEIINLQEQLSRITCPTLVISADHDYTPVAQKEIYVKLLPDARLVVIEDSRHATPLDQPEVLDRKSVV